MFPVPVLCKQINKQNNIYFFACWSARTGFLESFIMTLQELQQVNMDTIVIGSDRRSECKLGKLIASDRDDLSE